MQRDLKSLLIRLIASSLVFVTLLISPFVTLDPVNPLKSLALTTFAFVGLAILLANRELISWSSYRTPGLLITGFIFWLLIVFTFSSAEKTQQLFGVYGRNTGLITYVSLALLFISSMVLSGRDFLRTFLASSVFVGSISGIYGAIQFMDADPFPWQEIYSPVVGFLGNPNFQSSLLGVLGVVVFTQLFSQKEALELKLFYLLYLALTGLVIYGTESLQGFLVLLIGSLTATGIWITKRNKIQGYAFLATSIFGFFAMLLGILNRGFLASFLHKESVTYRGDYWQAGWNMTLENPIIGVGLDNYGDWYRRSRTLEATLRRGPEVTSNAAHNVYLDISSNGGFPLLFLYTGLIGLVLYSAWKVLKRERDFNPGFTGLVAGWVAFQAQSMISINQIGLAIWGWVMSGLIIGYEISTRKNSELSETIKKRVSARKARQLQPNNAYLVIGLLFGFLIGMPTFLSSAKHNSALKQNNPVVIENTAYIWPYDPLRMIQVSSTLDSNNFESEGLKVGLDAVAKFPDNFAVWANLNALSNASVEQKSGALRQMKRLDPFNPNLK